MSLLCVKFVPITGTAKGIVLTHNSRCVLVRHWEKHWSRWQVDPKNFNKIQTKKKKFKIPDNESNYSQPLQSSGPASMETQWVRATTHEVFKTLNDLNPSFIRSTLSFSRYVSQKEYVHVLCSFPKYSKVWKQKLKVTWGAHMKLIAWKN